MVLVGAGALGAHFVRAHAAVRPIKRVFALQPHSRQGREPRRRTRKATASSQGRDAISKPAVREADIVSCVTTSTQPIVKGAWLKPGTHVDLAGAFKPTMRETDGETVARARVYVDTREGAWPKPAISSRPATRASSISRQVQGDLFDLCRGKVDGPRERPRRSPCSSPAARRSRTWPPPSWSICAMSAAKRAMRDKPHLRCPRHAGSRPGARAWRGALKPHVGYLKIGMEFFYAHGAAGYETVAAEGLPDLPRSQAARHSQYGRRGACARSCGSAACRRSSMSMPPAAST